MGGEVLCRGAQEEDGLEKRGNSDRTLEEKIWIWCASVFFLRRNGSVTIVDGTLFVSQGLFMVGAVGPTVGERRATSKKHPQLQLSRRSSSSNPEVDRERWRRGKVAGGWVGGWIWRSAPRASIVAGMLFGRSRDIAAVDIGRVPGRREMASVVSGWCGTGRRVRSNARRLCADARSREGFRCAYVSVQQSYLDWIS
jgi:hypothetical protein